MPQSQPSRHPGKNRRTALAALSAGAVAVLTPLAAGVAAFVSPLFRKTKPPLVRVATLSQVPADGLPRLFPVVTDQEDAWNRYPDRRVGAVYLLRQPDGEKPIALSAKCPHAGCFVGYVTGADRFLCPCHTSAFWLDGERVSGDSEVAPRGMDPLEVELREETIDGQSLVEVWVKFQDFQTGHSERIPTA